MDTKYQAHSFEVIFLSLIELDGISEDRETNLAWEIYQRIRSEGSSEVWISPLHIKAVIQQVRIDDGSLIIGGYFVHMEHRDSRDASYKTHQEWIFYLDKHASVIEQELTTFMVQMTDGTIKENTGLEIIGLYYDGRDY